MDKKLLIIVFISTILLVSPVSAKVVTTKVDDKGLLWADAYGLIGTLHTKYGEILVRDEDYNNVEINDTIRYDITKNTFWNYYWNIEVIR